MCSRPSGMGCSGYGDWGMSDKAREAAARAICENDSDETWDEEIDSSRAHYRRLARAAIDAYIAARRAEGFVEVPMNPTEAMIQDALDQFDWGPPGYDDAPGGCALPDRVYRAMLNAAPQQR